MLVASRFNFCRPTILSRAFSYAVLTIACLTPSFCNAQMIGISTPFTTATDSFYERMGINFGFRLPAARGNGSRIVGYLPNGQTIPNITFSQNGFSSAIPPFGGYDPSSNSRSGSGYQGRGGGGFNLGFEFGQGNNRTMVNQTPTLMIQNGGTGSIFDGNVRPFVSSVIPITGGGGGYRNAVIDAMKSGQLSLENLSRSREETRPTEPANYSNPDSSALAGDMSVSEIRARKQADRALKNEELRSLVRMAQSFSEKEDYRQARIYYRKAIKICTDPVVKRELKATLSELYKRK